MTKDDHPIRTIFLETLARFTGKPLPEVRESLKDWSTDYIDDKWPIDAAKEKILKG